MFSRAFLSAFLSSRHSHVLHDCDQDDQDMDDKDSLVTLTMFETCLTMDRWQQIGYFGYKARLRREINDDWCDIDHDIWVSILFFIIFFFGGLYFETFCVEFETTWFKLVCGYTRELRGESVSLGARLCIVMVEQ